MLIDISDPDDPAIVGQLFSADIVPESVLQGGSFNLFFSSTGSSDNSELFDLSEPPSFSGPPMVWGALNSDGNLELFLAPSTGEKTHQFAILNDFASFSGGGDLFRPNKLPDAVNWSVAP